MKLSIVSTLYKSSPYIVEFYQRAGAAAHKLVGEEYEIILVNDGSPDNSLNIALDLQEKDSKLTIIDLSRNFGHHKAVMTGLQYAHGDYVFLIDSDLEEDPELVNLFWDDLKKSPDIDLIYGIQKKRKGYLFERMSGSLIIKITNALSEIKMSENVIMARLMTHRYVKNLLLYTEREMVFNGLTTLTGYKQKGFPITKRHKGSTTYSLTHKINLALNYITSLSSYPLIFIFYVGLIIISFSLFFLLWIIYKSIFYQTAMGWASVAASIWLFGGIIIFFLGVIGIYLSKIFIEVKGRPLSIIKDIYVKKEKQE